MSVCRRPAFTLLSLLQVTTEPCPNDCSATVWGEQNRHWLCRADSHLLRILPSTTEIRESSSGPTTEPALSTYLESILPLNASSANPQPGRKCWRQPIGKQHEFPADIERARDSAGNGTSLGYYMKKYHWPVQSITQLLSTDFEGLDCVSLCPFSLESGWRRGQEFSKCTTIPLVLGAVGTTFDLHHVTNDSKGAPLQLLLLFIPDISENICMWLHSELKVLQVGTWRQKCKGWTRLTGNEGNQAQPPLCSCPIDHRPRGTVPHPGIMHEVPMRFGLWSVVNQQVCVTPPSLSACLSVGGAAWGWRREGNQIKEHPSSITSLDQVSASHVSLE